MYLKNTAGQHVCFQGVDTVTGGIKSGVSWTVRRCIDGTFAAATGTATEDGSTGWYKFALSQADTNGNNIGFNFTGTGAVPQTVNIVTTVLNPYDSVRGGMTALPNAAADAAGGLPISDAGGLDLDSKLANTNEVTAARMGALTDWINGGRLDLILDIIAADTTTDIPALIATLQAFVDTEVAAILAAVDTEVAAILADTNELQTDWANGGRLDLILDARASQASVDDLPTNAELATALAAADDAVLAAIAALNNLSAAQVNAEADQALADVGLTTTITGRVDAAISTRATPAQILTTALVEAYGADGAAPTLSQLLFLLLAVLTEASVSGTTLTAKKLDGSTAAATFTLNDGTNPTSISRAS